MDSARVGYAGAAAGQKEKPAPEKGRAFGVWGEGGTGSVLAVVIIGRVAFAEDIVLDARGDDAKLA